MSASFSSDFLDACRDSFIQVQFDNYRRLYWDEYGPLNVIPSNTRFCGDDWDEGVIYAGDRFEVAFAETMIRDKYDGELTRILQMSDITPRAVAGVSFTEKLTLMDLTGSKAIAKGIPNAVFRSDDHTSGRKFARSIKDAHKDCAGIIFPSRLIDGCQNIAIFGEFSDRLAATRIGALSELTELERVIKAWGLSIDFD